MASLFHFNASLYLIIPRIFFLFLFLIYLHYFILANFHSFQGFIIILIDNYFSFTFRFSILIFFFILTQILYMIDILHLSLSLNTFSWNIWSVFTTCLLFFLNWLVSSLFSLCIPEFSIKSIATLRQCSRFFANFFFFHVLLHPVWINLSFQNWSTSLLYQGSMCPTGHSLRTRPRSTFSSGLHFSCKAMTVCAVLKVFFRKDFDRFSLGWDMAILDFSFEKLDRLFHLQ